MANNISDIAAKATIDVGPASRSMSTLEQQTRNSTARIARDTAAASAGAQRSLQQTMAGFGLARLAPIGMAAAGVSAVNQALRGAFQTRADAQVQEVMRGDTSFMGRANMANQAFLDAFPMTGGIRDFFTVEAREALARSNEALARAQRNADPTRQFRIQLEAATDSLREQAETFNMTTGEARRYRLEMQAIRAGVPRGRVAEMLAGEDATFAALDKILAGRQHQTALQAAKQQEQQIEAARMQRLEQRAMGESPELGDLEMGSRAAQAVINAAMAPRQMERVAQAIEELVDLQSEDVEIGKATGESLDGILDALTTQDPFATTV